jgi:hypothetical protein
MNKTLNALLMLLIAFPWFAITAAACPMRHALQEEHSEAQHKPGCCSHEQAGVAHHARHHKTPGCNGDCCPVCHLVQDTPQDGEDLVQLPPVHSKIILLNPEIAKTRFASVSQEYSPPLTLEYLHLKIPIPVTLRI